MLSNKGNLQVWKQLAETDVYISDKEKLISNMIMPPYKLSFFCYIISPYQEFPDCGLGCVQTSSFFSDSWFTIVALWNQKRVLHFFGNSTFSACFQLFYFCSFHNRTKVEVGFPKTTAANSRTFIENGLQWNEGNRGTDSKCSLQVCLEWITSVAPDFCSFDLAPSKIYLPPELPELP